MNTCPKIILILMYFFWLKGDVIVKVKLRGSNAVCSSGIQFSQSICAKALANKHTWRMMIFQPGQLKRLHCHFWFTIKRTDAWLFLSFLFSFSWGYFRMHVFHHAGLVRKAFVTKIRTLNHWQAISLNHRAGLDAWHHFFYGNRSIRRNKRQ